MNKANVISAFPGTGKTHFFENNKEFKVLDSDSSQFSWLKPGIRNPDFPKNYIIHIKENLDKYDYIFVSSHKEVRDEMVSNGIKFHLVYPGRQFKGAYIMRYKERGSPDAFIDMISRNWDVFLDELCTQDCEERFELEYNEYVDYAVRAIQRRINMHKSHCNQGEYINLCKYNYDDCPAQGSRKFGSMIANFIVKENDDSYMTQEKFDAISDGFIEVVEWHGCSLGGSFSKGDKDGLEIE